MPTFLFALLAAFSNPAAAGDLKLDFSGRIQTDLRFRLDTPETGPWYAPFPHQPEIIRSQNILNTKLKATKGSFSGVADIDIVMIGRPDTVLGIEALSARRTLDPFRIEAHALYIEGRDLFVRGLDLRLGQQLAQWGVGDQFNPTNTLNANDIEDPLLFGEQQANLMARLDYSPGGGNWTFTGVLIPVFRPALIPPSGVLGLASVQRLPFTNDDIRWRIHSERDLASELFSIPTVVENVNPVLPKPDFANMQYSFRVGGWVGGQDIGLSYYRGFSDVPQAATTHSTQDTTDRCNPDNEEECIDGVLNNQVSLIFPRMHVAGFNMAGEMNVLGWMHRSIQPIGYRIEFAMFFPEKTQITLTNDDLNIGGISQPAGEYDYQLGEGQRPTIIDGRPFAKWVLGLDYTFGRHLYVNAQWVHGMLDEFGAGDFIQEGYVVRDGGVSSEPLGTTTCVLAKDGKECAWETLRSRIGDYIVVGTDIRFLSGSALFRMFTILDLTGAVDDRWDANSGQRVRTRFGPFTPEGFGMVLYPQLSYNFGNGLELTGGALLNLGKPHGKFGDPAAGGSMIWTQGKYSF